MSSAVLRQSKEVCQNSERDVHSLNVPLTRSVTQGEEVIWIRPSDWLRYIVNKGFGAVSEDHSEPCRDVHGDEGRTLKILPIMITQLQSCLGAGFAKQRKRPSGGAQVRVNFAAPHLPAVSS